MAAIEMAGLMRRRPRGRTRPHQHAEHRRIERMPSVDRNILRLAVFEMMHSDTPPPVVIDEALELARRYSNEESAQFVNGVLDAVHRDLMREKAVGGRL